MSPFNKEQFKEKPPAPEVYPSPEKEIKEVEILSPEKEKTLLPEQPSVSFPPSHVVGKKSTKTEIGQKIEEILSQDLEIFTEKLSPIEKKKFEIKTEETAGAIEKIINSAKIASQKILNIIKRFLRLLKGVNRFFIEKESKIKTDKILDLAKKRQQNSL
jgi:hypothetical protein